jgi:2-iminobutanoate/2-iminopropanoate deaminase
MSALKKIEGEGVPKAAGPYSQAVKDGKWVFVSGQLPIDPKTGEVVEREIRTQTRRVLDNMEQVLKAAGCGLKNVARCDIFLKSLNDFAALNEEYAKRFAQEVPPARQTIEAGKLPLDVLVEISCIAIIHK